MRLVLIIYFNFYFIFTENFRGPKGGPARGPEKGLHVLSTPLPRLPYLTISGVSNGLR